MIQLQLTATFRLLILHIFFTPSSSLAIASVHYRTNQSNGLAYQYQSLHGNSSDSIAEEPSNTTGAQIVVIALSAIIIGTIALFWLAYFYSSLQKGTGQPTCPTPPAIAAGRAAPAPTSPVAECSKNSPTISMEDFDKAAPASTLSDYQKRRAGLMTAAAVMAATSYLIWLVIKPLGSNLVFLGLTLVLYSAICLDTIGMSDEVRELPCHHLYHSKCIIECVCAGHDTCPLCKARILCQQKQETNTEAQDGSTMLVRD